MAPGLDPLLSGAGHQFAHPCGAKGECESVCLPGLCVVYFLIYGVCTFSMASHMGTFPDDPALLSFRGILAGQEGEKGRRERKERKEGEW